MRPTATQLCAGALMAAIALTGCSGHAHQKASVATSFGQESGSQGPASASASASASAGVSPASAATPCPVASPQLVVEGKQATTNGGQVTFSYLDAARVCSGDEHSRYVTTGKKLSTKPVSPSAVILLLAPGGRTDELQVPPAALPAAMSSSKAGSRYFTITVDGSGAITRIEQAYLP